MSRNYDVIVIGSGPAGEGAAMSLTKSGKHVAVAEKYIDVGGGCTHWGTIPSKALRHTVQQFADYKSDPLLRRLIASSQIGYNQLLDQASPQYVNKFQHVKVFIIKTMSTFFLVVPALLTLIH